MDSSLGLLRIRVLRGINLSGCDNISSSDPYVVVAMGEQKVKTWVMNDDCNTDWNDELTLSVKDPNIPITLTVYDKDSFTRDDNMGDANLDIKPLLDCIKNSLEDLPKGVEPSIDNCLAHESCIVWKDGKLSQDMTLKLKNVERGAVEIQIVWIDLPSYVEK